MTVYAETPPMGNVSHIHDTPRATISLRATGYGFSKATYPWLKTVRITAHGARSWITPGGHAGRREDALSGLVAASELPSMLTAVVGVAGLDGAGNGECVVLELFDIEGTA